MGARLFVGIAGAAVIILAAMGLAIDLDRGGVREHQLAPSTYNAILSIGVEVTPGTTGPGGQCLVTQCTPTSSTLTFRVSGLPDLAALPLSYALDVGADRGLGPMQRQGAWTHVAEFDRDISGEPLTIRVTDGAWSKSLVTTTAVDVDAAEAPVSLVDGTALLLTEQIGAAEVSALIDARVDVAPPAGWVFRAQVDGRPIGLLEEGILDVRVERLDLGAARQFELVMVRADAVAADPLAQAPGVIVFAAAL